MTASVAYWVDTVGGIVAIVVGIAALFLIWAMVRGS